jgi:hypothetical protein
MASMRSRKHSTPFDPLIVLELAGHTAMGVALGLGLSLALMFFDAFGVRKLIAHSFDPQSSTIVFAGTFALAFAIGATLTGFILVMMERDKRSGSH